jgi:hypothetical protein
MAVVGIARIRGISLSGRLHSPDCAADTEHFVIAAPNLMTPSMSLVYEETYKDQSIEIYCFSHFAPGGVGSSYFYAIIDDYRLPGNFDGRSHNPFCPSEIQEIRELRSNRQH